MKLEKEPFYRTVPQILQNEEQITTWIYAIRSFVQGIMLLTSSCGNGYSVYRTAVCF